jgi:outer membrane protein assembly factor BamB
MRVPLQVLLLLMVVVAGCTAGDGGIPAGQSAAPSVARLAASPPLLGPDGQVRFVTTAANEVRAEDAATGAIRWTLPTPVLAAGSSLHWRLLVAGDGSSVYVQSVLDGGGPTYLGTRRVDARTGVELASDIKFEIYWYENVVLWTALADGGALQMAIERARAAGGGYRFRTFDPLTLKMLTDVQQPAPPSVPRA